MTDHHYDRATDERPDHADDGLPQDDGRYTDGTEQQLVETHVEQPLYQDLHRDRAERCRERGERDDTGDDERQVAFATPLHAPAEAEAERQQVQERPNETGHQNLGEVPLYVDQVSPCDPVCLVQDLERPRHDSFPLLSPVSSRNTSSSVVRLML